MTPPTRHLSPFEISGRSGVMVQGQTGFTSPSRLPGDIAPTSRAHRRHVPQSPQPTKTESEKAFQLSFIANVVTSRHYLEHLRGCGLCDLAGGRQYHASPSANVRGKSRCLRLWVLLVHSPLLFVARRSHCRSRRAAWSSKSPQGWWVRCPFAILLLAFCLAEISPVTMGLAS